ncbi:MAG: hypothetical protein DRR08_24145 [Candidatus Parabeggiatoa sp. nov. 2]|nr:MAG: hypothetical protein DRR08_24145 [Gammaproteobacteria bacterium]
MKIERLIAEAVFGHLNFELKFNHDMTFLTGINGNGKTTALRLILALSTPSLRELEQIPHHSVELLIQADDKHFTIKSTCYHDKLLLSVNTETEPLEYSRLNLSQLEERDAARIEEHYSITEEKFYEHPVIKCLSHLETPTFLGLEKRQPAIYPSPIYNLHPSSQLITQKKRPFRDAVGASLSELQLLIQEFFRKIRHGQDRFNEKLKEDILLSVFQYEPVSAGHFANFDLLKWQEREFISHKREEIENTLAGLGLKEAKFKQVIDDFFDRLLKRLATADGKEGPEGLIEWLVNKPQIERITKIFQIVDDYKDRMDQLMAPITRFLSLVNRFLADTHKELQMDAVGWLVVKMKGQPDRTLEALSSGERQIVTILAHLALNEHRSQAGVFIVDEPELSLHLKWQEIFIEALIEASPSTQFILATHAPAIVLEREDKCLTMRS